MTVLINVYTCYQALGIPCFLGGMARGLLGRNSNLHIRQRRRDALKEADLVILAGMVSNNKEKNTGNKKSVCGFVFMVLVQNTDNNLGGKRLKLTKDYR